MGTALNPDIYISFWDTSLSTPAWVQIQSDASHFRIKDAGVLKIPTATVHLLNPANLPAQFELLRIQADVRGSQDMPFYGTVAQVIRRPISGTISDKTFQLTCYGLEKRLKRDTISWEYEKEQSAHGDMWTFKSMIEDTLALGDSGYPTNITLDTDAGDITNSVYGDCNFKRQTMLDAIRIVAETIGYDGYVWIDGSTAKLKFVGLGTLASSPATTLNDPFIGTPTLTRDIDEIRNYILVWGGTGIPR